MQRHPEHPADVQAEASVRSARRPGCLLHRHDATDRRLCGAGGGRCHTGALTFADMTAESVTTSQSSPAAQAPPTVRASLSPSRAADFKTCPLLYRFRSIDRLPERTTIEQARGTLVHAVLERLFDLPATGRTPEAAGDLVAPQWDRLVTEQPELAGIFDGAEPAGPVEFLRSAAGLLQGYFAVEDPTPAGAGRTGEPDLRGRRRGVADPGLPRPARRRPGRRAAGGRLQDRRRAAGGVRGAGAVPAEVLRPGAVAHPGRGAPGAAAALPARTPRCCDYTPDADELVRFERTLVALWRAIEQATARQDFRPRPSRLCDWCSHQALCPELRRHPAAVPGRRGERRPAA